MDPLVGILLVAILLVATLLYVRSRKQPQEESEVATDVADNDAQPAAPQPKPRAQLRQRNIRRRERTVAAAATADSDDDEEGNEEDDAIEVATHDAQGNKLSKKKAQKLAQKDAKKRAHEAERHAQEEKRERERLRQEADKEREMAEEEKRKAEAAEEEERIAEEKRKEQEEYDAIKNLFVVEEGGAQADEIESESQGLLGEFVDFIKAKKVVPYEDLAATFNLKTQEAINRVQALERMGRITGVEDDRGKFIFISTEELEGVAKFIRQRGRVSMEELAENSSNLITLESTE